MGAAEHLFVDGQQPQQFDDRRLVVVHAKVDEPVVAPGVAAVFPDDKQRGRLSAA